MVKVCVLEIDISQTSHCYRGGLQDMSVTVDSRSKFLNEWKLRNGYYIVQI